MPFLSPLRYPGGKGKLSKYIESIFIENNISDSPYIEPYAGGAGIAFYLLFNKITPPLIIPERFVLFKKKVENPNSRSE